MIIFLNPLNLQQRRFMKNFPVVRVLKCPKRPPRETAKSPSLEVLKNRLHKQLSRAAQTYVILPSSRGIDKETSWDLCLGFCPSSAELQPKATHSDCLLPVTASTIGGSTSCVAVLPISFPLPHNTRTKGREIYVGYGCVPLLPGNHTQQAKDKEVWELLGWGLGHHFPASLPRKSSGLKPDLPPPMAQGQVQPNWPGECRPVTGAIP